MRSKIQLMPGLTWETLPVSREYVSIDRGELIEKLRKMADEWREACGSQDLYKALTTAGEMITDFGIMIGLETNEITNILSGQPDANE